MTALTDRMRTCAAFLIDRKAAGDPWAAEIVALDAADLLLEASNAIEQLEPVAPAELGEPMALIEPLTGAAAPIEPVVDGPAWVDPGGQLPGLKRGGTVSSRACPSCDSRAYKRVFRKGREMMLHCPACGNEWPFKFTGA